MESEFPAEESTSGDETSHDPSRFGGVVPIDEGFDAKAAALRRQRQESFENRGVEALDDLVHGAEIPKVSSDEPRGPRGRGRDRGEGRGGRGDRRASRERRPRRDREDAGRGPAVAPAPSGYMPELGPKAAPVRPLPGPSFDRGAPASMIEGPLTGAPAYGGATSFSGTGDVHALRREIEDLRGQLQRSLSGAGAPAASLYVDAGARPIAPIVTPAAPLGPLASAPLSLFAAQRVAILADVPSLQRTAKRLFGRVVSYAKLLQLVVRGRGAVRAIAFVAERDAADPAFLGHLRQSGFEIRRTEAPAEGYRRSDAGASLALEATRLANRVDSIILASNDGDLLNLLPSLRAQGCRCEIAGFVEGAPEILRESADAFHPLGRDELI